MRSGEAVAAPSTGRRGRAGAAAAAASAESGKSDDANQAAWCSLLRLYQDVGDTDSMLAAASRAAQADGTRAALDREVAGDMSGALATPCLDGTVASIPKDYRKGLHSTKRCSARRDRRPRMLNWISGICDPYTRRSNWPNGITS